MNITIDTANKNIGLDQLVKQIGTQSQYVDNVSALSKKEELEILNKADKAKRRELIQENINASKPVKVPRWKKILKILFVVAAVITSVVAPMVAPAIVGATKAVGAVKFAVKFAVNAAMNVVSSFFQAGAGAMDSSMKADVSIQEAEAQAKIDIKSAEVDFLTESYDKSLQNFAGIHESAMAKQKAIAQAIKNYDNSLIKG